MNVLKFTTFYNILFLDIEFDANEHSAEMQNIPCSKSSKIKLCKTLIIFNNLQFFKFSVAELSFKSYYFCGLNVLIKHYFIYYF